MTGRHGHPLRPPSPPEASHDMLDMAAHKDKHMCMDKCVYVNIHIYIYKHILIGIKRSKQDYINKHISLFCYQVYIYISISLACSGVKHQQYVWTDLRDVCHHSDVSYHFKTESECLSANMYPLVNCPITMENHHF